MRPLPRKHQVTPMSLGNEHLHGITRAIFHIVARIEGLQDAEDKVVELLASVLDEALQKQKVGIIAAVVHAVKTMKMQPCKCGSGFVDYESFLGGLKKAFEIDGSSPSHLN